MGAREATITIEDDDPEPSLSFANATAAENDDEIEFTVNLSAASDREVTVDYSVEGRSAELGTDFQDATGTLTFAPGTTSRTFTVTVLDDVSDEDREQFVVRLANPANATLANAAATGFIDDNDDPPLLGLRGGALPEGDPVTFEVTLTPASGKTVTVQYRTSDGPADTAAQAAVDGEDYTGVSGTLTFDPGEASKDVVVATVEDTVNEATERFRLTIHLPLNARLPAAPFADGVIVDDDGEPSLSVADVTAGEADGEMVFTVTLSPASGRQVEASWATVADTATAGVDFSAGSGALTFAVGETSKEIRVALLNDQIQEDSESFHVDLTLGDSPGADLARARATGTITDDDLPVVTVATEQARLNEGGEATFTVTRANHAAKALVVGLEITATSFLAGGADLARQVTFAADESEKALVISTDDDEIDEPDGRLKVTVTPRADYRAGTPASASLELLDNDVAGIMVTIELDPGASVHEDEGDIGITYTAATAGTVRPDRDITFSIRTESDNASAGADYTALSEIIHIRTGDFTPTANGNQYTASVNRNVREQALSIAILEDTEDEPDETFRIKTERTAGSFQVEPPADLTITILDNDEPPGKPVLSGTVGDAQVTLNWTAPDAGTSTITSYEYRRSADGGTTWPPDWTAVGNVITYTVTGLANGVAHTFEVRARSVVGPGPASEALTLMTTIPSVTGVSFTSSPPAGQSSTYKLADTITLEVVFSEPVDVTGTPTLDLAVGSDTAAAGYTGGTGTDTLAFAYTVRADDVDRDGAGVPANSLKLAGGTIRKQDSTTQDANLALAALASQSGQQVDGAAPALRTATVSGDQLVLTWDEALNSGAAPAASAFALGYTGTGTTPTISGVAVSGTVVTLTLSRVTTREDTLTISYTAPSGASALQDLAGNPAADFTDQAVTNQSVPTVTVSFDAADYTVTEGADVEVTVTLSADPERGVTILIVATPGGGASAADYTVAGSVTFAIGEISKVLTFGATGDTEDDDDETVALSFGTLPFAVAAGATTTATVAITDDDSVPGAPALTAAPADGKVTLTWTAPADPGSSAITSYEYRYKATTAASFGAWTDAGNDLSEEVIGLTNGTEYTFELRAKSAAGDGPASDPIAATPTEASATVFVTIGPKEGAASVVEGTVAEFTLTRVEPHTDALTVNVSVTQAGAVIKTADSYVAPREVVFGAGDGTATLPVETQADALDEQNGTITAEVTVGTGYAPGSPASANVMVTDDDELPGKPVISAAAPGNAQVTLTWTAPAQTGTSPVTGYDYRYKADGAAAFGAWRDAGAGTTATVDSLTNGTEYTFEVRAKSAAGDGPASDPIAATPTEASATVPSVSDVSFSSLPAVGQNDTYKLGDRIEVEVAFSEAVDVTGTPTVDIKIGAATKQATYTGSHGTDTLAFAYTVQTGEEDSDGAGIEANGLKLPSGSGIKKSGTETDAERVYAAQSDQAGHKVDGIVPELVVLSIAEGSESSVGQDRIYSAGDSIWFVTLFSEDVVVEGQPYIEFMLGGQARQAPYRGTVIVFDVLDGQEFRYTVVAADLDTDGVSVAANPMRQNGGRFRDAAGNGAVLDHKGFADDAGHKVYGVRVTTTVVLPDGPVGAPFDARVAFSHDVTGFVDSDITVGNGAVTAFVATNAREYVATITPAASGQVSVSVAADVAQYAANTDNGNQASETETVTADLSPAPDVSIEDATASEADRSMSFTVSLAATSSFDVSVDYATSDDTATAGEDYMDTSSTLTIPAGNMSGTIEVPILDDGLFDEGEEDWWPQDEAFKVTLSQPMNAVLGRAEATGTIEDDEADQVALTIVVDVKDRHQDSPSYSVDRGLFRVVFTFHQPGCQICGIAVNTLALNDISVTGGTKEDSLLVTYDGATQFLEITPDENATEVVVSVAKDVVFVKAGDVMKEGIGNKASELTVTIVGTSSQQQEALEVKEDDEAAPTVKEDDEAAPTVKEDDEAAPTVKEDDETAPTVKVTSEAPALVSDEFEVTVRFSEPVTDFEMSELEITNGYAARMASFSDGTGYVTEYTVHVTPYPDASGALSITAPAGVATDAAGNPNTASEPFTISVFVEGPITGFTLFDNATGTDVRALSEGVVLDVISSNQLNIRAEIAPDEELGSVRMELTGAQSSSRTENLVPYVLFGDQGGQDFPTGEYRISATPYPEPDLGGEPGPTLSMTFTVGPGAEPSLLAADARVTEAAGAALEFTVILLPASAGTVTVDYETADGAAHAGEDYEAASGTLTFAPGETERTISVTVLDDAKDEGEETFTLRLSNASGASLGDAEATGTIINSDPLPKAWLARFGRTAAGHVVDAVGTRVSESPGSDSHVTIAGQRMSLGAGASGAAPPEAAALAWGGRLPDERPWNGRLHEGRRAAGLRTITGRELLAGSSFQLSLGAAEDGTAGVGPGMRWTTWGRGAATRFGGADGDLSLRGDVLTATLGLDVEWARWLAGVAVSHSIGAGSFDLSGAGVGGELDSSLTSLHPYIRLSVNERLSAWGVLGYGRGELTLTEDRTGNGIETETGMVMGAFGARGVLLSAAETGGFELTARSDALLMRMTSAAVETAPGRLEAAGADTSRVRLALEGSHEVKLASGGALTPSLELGLRHDGGDAETGTGLELGAGFRYADPARGLTVEANVRGLVAHEDSSYEEWGARGSIRLDPGALGRGLTLTLAPTWGAASSGVERLWSRHDMAGLAANDDFDPASRLNAELGYGLDVPGGRGVLTPYGSLTLSNEGTRAYRLGWRFKLGETFSLSLDGERRESVNAAPEHALMLRGSLPLD